MGKRTQRRYDAFRDALEELTKSRAEWENSEEGRAAMAKKAAEKAELEEWIASDGGVDVTSWGGIFPDQWWGQVDGHTFYFREKHGHWSIELDLRPSGRFYKQIVQPQNPGESIDLENTEDVEIEEGDVIAEGWETDLGVTPLHRGRFIANTIRTHLRREGCAHPGARRFCPECGTAMT